MDNQDIDLENPPPQSVKMGTECAETGIDWFNKLPDSLVVEILSLMPLTDACKTTVLSKRWNYMWTSIHNVIFGWDIEWSFDVDEDKLISFMDNALCRLSRPKIRKFHLCFDFSLFESHRSKLEEWIGMSVEKDVRDVELNLVQYCDLGLYTLPQVLCSCSTLEKLRCRNCSISEDSVIKWTSLKSLMLENSSLTDKAIAEILSGSPLLESLALCNFNGFRSLHMTSPTCRKLELNSHNNHIPLCSFGEDCSLEIVAPYVQHLKISGDLACMKISLGDVSSLVHAELTFSCGEAHSGPNREHFKDMVKHLLKSICCASELTISSWFLEVVSMLKTEGFSFPLLKCKQLTVNSTIRENTILGIGVLLRSAPQLENLEIRGRYYDDPNNAFGIYWDETIEFLEGDYLSSLLENTFKGSVQNLKNAKISPTFCDSAYRNGGPAIRNSAHRNGVTEVSEVAEILLKHAIVLEKLVIAPAHGGTCSLCSTNMSIMAENSLAFARASHSAVVTLEY